MLEDFLWNWILILSNSLKIKYMEVYEKFLGSYEEYKTLISINSRIKVRNFTTRTLRAAIEVPNTYI